MKQITAQEVAGLCAAAAAHAAPAAGTTTEGADTPVLLDVREAWEFELAAIRVEGGHTLHIPMGEIPARLAEIDAARPVVCICHHGMRSAQVVAFLERQGWPTVYNLAGGIEAWSTQVDARVARY
jgi:rhodanese-related sulfurtransferase